MSLRVSLVVGVTGFTACACAFFALGLYIYWDSPRLINFLAAWIPFILSVLFAFVPSGKEMKHQWIKWTWRGGVLVVGFFWSIMLWHQQDLSDRASAAQTKNALGSAVSQANDHADQQFKKVQDQVSDVKNNLKTTENNIATKLDQSTSTLNAGLGKVGKPEPAEPAKLTFSLWDTTASADKPVLSKIVQPDKDGNFPVEFSFLNGSESTAEAIDIWIRVCDECSFSKEPDGFEKPAGIDEHLRHRVIGSLNPSVNFEKMTILVKSPLLGHFQIGFKYACKTCGGKMSPLQFATVNEGSPPALKPQ